MAHFAKLDENNIVFCGRMVKDEQLRILRKKVGKTGGNPSLINKEEFG